MHIVASVAQRRFREHHAYPQAAPRRRLGQEVPPPMCAAFALPLQKPLGGPALFLAAGHGELRAQFFNV